MCKCSEAMCMHFAENSVRRNLSYLSFWGGLNGKMCAAKYVPSSFVECFESFSDEACIWNMNSVTVYDLFSIYIYTKSTRGRVEIVSKLLLEPKATVSVSEFEFNNSFISPFYENYSVNSDNQPISSSLSGNKSSHWNLNTQWPYCGRRHFEIGYEECQRRFWTKHDKFLARRRCLASLNFRKTLQPILLAREIGLSVQTHRLSACHWVENFHFDTAIVALLTSTRSTLVKLKFFAFFGWHSSRTRSFVALSFLLRIFFHILRFCFTPKYLIFHDFKARVFWTKAVNL